MDAGLVILRIIIFPVHLKQVLIKRPMSPEVEMLYNAFIFIVLQMHKQKY